MAHIPKDSEYIGTTPVPKLLLKFALPAILSTTINCLYNIVDRLYIGQGVGADAQAGLSLTFPLMIILMAFGMLVGQGSAAVVSILLGEKRKGEAEKVVGQALAMFIIFVLTVQTFSLIFLDKILVWFGGTPQSIPYAHAYLSIILWGNVFQHISFGMSNVIRAEGCPVKSMLVVCLGAILNIILDPIFIFTLHMGIRGAAYATVLSMMTSSAWVILHFSRVHGVLQLHLHNIRIFPALCKRVVAIGMAPCLMQFVHCAVVVIFNHSFIHFATDDGQATSAIAAYGVNCGVVFCMLMPCFGIMQGMQPIVGYNTGAKLYNRVCQTYSLAMWISTASCIFFAILAYIFATPISQCFSKDTKLIAITAYSIRMSSLGFTFIAPGVITGSYFQSVGKAAIAAIISLSRQCFVLIPFIVFLPRLFGFNGIWWSGPASDFISGVACYIIYAHEILRLKRKSLA